MTNAWEQLSEVYLTYLLKGDKIGCSNLAIQQISSKKLSITDFYENVIKPALYKVGLLWEMNEIGVATEHLATAITEGVLNDIYSISEHKTLVDRKVVVACTENELHQVGIKMVADVFEMHGWESFFLGTGIPTSELIRYIHEVNPDVIALSLSVYFNYKSLKSMVDELITEFPEINLVIGGQAVQRLSDKHFQNNNKVKLVSELYSLHKYIQTIN